MSSTSLSASFASLSFDEKLDRLAEVAVRVGLNLRAGQELLLPRRRRHCRWFGGSRNMRIARARCW